MLRLLVTIAVGFALLVGIGAWFDPHGAREAIRRDLAGVADHGEALRREVESALSRDLEELARKAAEEAGEVARAAAEEAGEVARAAAEEAGEVAQGAADRATELAREAAERVAEPSDAPARGPRTERKRPPVIAKAEAPAAEPAPGAAAERPVEETDEVEEVEVVAAGEFSEGVVPEEPEPSGVRVSSYATPSAEAATPSAGAATPSDAPAPPDVGEQGVLIRRMLALYQRVSERR